MFWQLITVYNSVKTSPELYKWHFIIFALTDLVLWLYFNKFTG